MSELHLRPMREADLAAVLAIEQAVQESPWSKGIFRDSLRVNYHCFVLESNDVIHGFSVFFVKAKECHIFNLSVRPQSQRRGYGKRLLQHVLKMAKEKSADVAFLEVRYSNEAAIALYRQFGFNELGRRKNYYTTEKGKEDALILGLSL